jgi:hypothetical protein
LTCSILRTLQILNRFFITAITANVIPGVTLNHFTIIVQRLRSVEERNNRNNSLKTKEEGRAEDRARYQEMKRKYELHDKDLYLSNTVFIMKYTTRRNSLKTIFNRK